MGNEAEANERKKILTSKSSFNQINCREIQDSDSENEDNLKKGISKQSLSDSFEEENMRPIQKKINPMIK